MTLNRRKRPLPAWPIVQIRFGILSFRRSRAARDAARKNRLQCLRFFQRHDWDFCGLFA
jgi:hypothetical protein